VSHRSRAVAACALALTLHACSGDTPTTPSEGVAGVARPPLPAPVPVAGIVAGIVDQTNAERRRAGLAVLRVEDRLAQAAQLQAEQTAATGRLDHVLPGAPYPQPEDRLAAVGYRWQAYGENLAFGYTDASSAVAGWMNSQGHRDNILSPAFTEIGVGQAFDRSGRPYYAQVFGRPR
jgi:uncharacterized protein YkwD